MSPSEVCCRTEDRRLTAKKPKPTTRIVPTTKRTSCQREEVDTVRVQVRSTVLSVGSPVQIAAPVEESCDSGHDGKTNAIYDARANNRETLSSSFAKSRVTVTTPVATVVSCFADSAAKSKACLRHSSTGRPDGRTSIEVQGQNGRKSGNFSQNLEKIEFRWIAVI